MAEKKFFVDINLQGSALTNAKIGTNSGIGSTEGAFGFDSASHRLQYFDGTATKDVANLSDISAVTGGLIFQGGYDPTTDTPDITDGSALKGFLWVATAAGTFLEQSVQVGDSIVAKVDNAGVSAPDWLILQGNVVIATDSVDGISRLATQTEANDGTEGGAVVITPATLQGKIDAQITPAINDKLSKSGDTMSGNLNMGNNTIDDVNNIRINAAPTDGKDATNKSYVDTTAATAQANAEATASADATTKADAAQAAAQAYADSLAPNYGAAGAAATAESNANAYTDTGLAAKLDLAGGTMSGSVNFNNNSITDLGSIFVNSTVTDTIEAQSGNEILVLHSLDMANHAITNVPAPTDGGDAANKEYVDTTAATAESNANDYTDAEITATRFKSQYLPESWVYDSINNEYYLEVTHNFGTDYPVVQVYDGSNNRLAEFLVENQGASAVRLYSNILPVSDVLVSVRK